MNKEEKCKYVLVNHIGKKYSFYIPLATYIDIVGYLRDDIEIFEFTDEDTSITEGLIKWVELERGDKNE